MALVAMVVVVVAAYWKLVLQQLHHLDNQKRKKERSVFLFSFVFILFPLLLLLELFCVGQRELVVGIIGLVVAIVHVIVLFWCR